jgi:multiple sugar transport system ATP-binding protein
MANVTLNHVCKSYGDLDVLKGIDLEINDREFVVFVGPSGCGKSTLLRMIAGLEEITSGDLVIDGQRCNDVQPAKRGLAMVFQSYALYAHMTVADNMAFSLKLAGVSAEERAKKVQNAARILKLEPYLERKPRALSGGQRQRVAIGRAIVRDPRVFLFDEPLSNLDAALRVQMRIELARLHEDLNATMIYVTHDQVEAMTLADKIVVLNAGRVEQVGSPLELYHNPRNQFVAGFIGSPTMNFVPVTVEQAGVEGVRVRLPDNTTTTLTARRQHPAPGKELTLGIRPEALTLSDTGLQGQVIVSERLGGLTYLYVQIGGGPVVVVQVEGLDRTQPHQTVHLRLDPATCHLFDSEGLAVAPAVPAPHY